MIFLKKKEIIEIRAFDPHVENTMVITDMEEATRNSDLILVLTDHNEFKNLDTNLLNNMSNKRILDTKNVVKNYPNSFEYINFGNLHEALKKEAALV